MVFETERWLFEFHDQYRQFFHQCNWYDFTFFHFDVEWDKCMGSVEATLVLLGLRIRISYIYDYNTEARHEIRRRVGELFIKEYFE